MPKTQKILTTVLWGLMVLVMVSVISAGLFLPREGGAANHPATKPADPTVPGVIGQAPAFDLVDQNGQKVSTESLRGKVWVADFIFTHCAGPCREMTRTMGELQVKLNDPSVVWVSISVDPKRDTPEVLKAYGDQFQANHDQWKFLTGDEELIHKVSYGMLLPVKKATDDQPILHSERFVLVDAQGRIRSAEHSKEGDMDLFLSHVRTVAAEAKGSK